MSWVSPRSMSTWQERNHMPSAGGAVSASVLMSATGHIERERQRLERIGADGFAHARHTVGQVNRPKSRIGGMLGLGIGSDDVAG